MASAWDWNPTSSGSGAGEDEEMEEYDWNEEEDLARWNSMFGDTPLQEDEDFAGDTFVANHTYGTGELRQGEMMNE